jgi:hypothetical protein
MNKLQEKFEKWKVDREVDEHNESHEFRQGYVKAMCHAINEVKLLNLDSVIVPVCEHNGRKRPDPLGGFLCVECGEFVNKAN